MFSIWYRALETSISGLRLLQDSETLFTTAFTLLSQEKLENSEMSAPATNAFVPLPVRMITLMDLSASALLNAKLNSFIVSLLSAFNLSGLLIVIIPKPFLFSTRIILKRC